MKLHLRYCCAWHYEPKAVSLTEKLLSSYKQRIKGFELEPSDGGCFELSADGELVYSKLKTGQFPDEDAVVEEIGARLER